MHVYLGADHRGYQLKVQIINWLSSLQIPFTDFGANEFNAEDDYNDYARKVAEAILRNPGDESFGVLACGSGQGMCMQANRYKGVRAAICHDTTEAVETRGHNNANVICISADTVGNHYADILEAFFNTKPLPDERYSRRCQKLDEV
ncbi:RpiB/LacA/LacB family sugar-phosphate isomerase [Candidatus Saccharibacteria bacterium]|nr:RpiB/LacA/LacB family sugar-phosphate isomerase [Candidatus Saccharibacteria bacterium]